jgi:hypothetical protein
MAGCRGSQVDGPQPRRARRTAALLLAAFVLAGCAGLPEGGGSGAPVAKTVTWATPHGLLTGHVVQPMRADGAPPAGLVVMQHGFMRQCRHLDGLRRALAREGWRVLCLDMPSAAGSAALADDIATALLEGSLAADGETTPQRIVVGGFSAGAVFAVRLGAALARMAPERLAGALLLDPVDARGLEDGLRAVDDGARRPWLAILANPGPCNAGLSALEPLARVANERRRDTPAAGVVVQLVRDSTHLDAEGADSSDLAIAACRQGPPLPANVAALRTLAAAWLARWSEPPLPAALDAVLEPLARAGTARRIADAAPIAPSSRRPPEWPRP